MENITAFLLCYLPVVGELAVKLVSVGAERGAHTALGGNVHHQTQVLLHQCYIKQVGKKNQVSKRAHGKQPYGWSKNTAIKTSLTDAEASGVASAGGHVGHHAGRRVIGIRAPAPMHTCLKIEH